MGWFGRTNSNDSGLAAPEPSKDGGYVAPDRSARARCWESRDIFFVCLDKNGIIDSVKEDEKAKQVCAPELKEFEKSCASSWVTYFKKRRVMEYKRDLTLKTLNAEGANSLDMTSAGAAGTSVTSGR
ncbi:hypothetical protein M433DRAFT_77169 [Acidomyces richmondensis BFW]|nr:MAG: hypothetical protein FE78DRAFT_32507 [Acidomyces sp. 'richmondensis']KYG40820.1 hypothetical protein M433DRAFT_77169 [Acidomyces richmondensis BFW]